MTTFASFLLKVISNKLAQELIILGLETAAKRSDNTVDDKVIEIVKAGLSNRTDPCKQGGGK